MRRRDFLQSALALTAAGLINPGRLPAVVNQTEQIGQTDAFHTALAEQPWLLGFETAAAQRFDTPRLTIEGSIPPQLRGTFYRNGPAKHVVGTVRYQHWFDGDGMVQAFRFSDAGVSHIGRFVETEKYRREAQAGKPLVWGFGTIPPGAQPPRSPAEVNAANINALPHAGRLLALWEAGDAYALDPNTLETRGPHYWSEETAGLPFSAHPRIEPDGTLWNFGLAPFRNMLLLYHISPQGHLKQLEAVHLEKAGMVHDFLATQRHLILVIPPLLFDRERIASGHSFLDSHVWHPEQGSQVLVFKKSDLSTYHTLELSPSFTFHYGNAWEDGNGVIRFDACRRHDASALFGGLRNVMHGGDFHQGAPPVCTLISLDVHKGTAQEEALGGETEFPRVDPRLSGRRNRFVYSVLRQPDNSVSHPLFNAVGRYDLESGQREIFRYPAEVCVEEHIFIPRPDGTAETDGWLMGTGLDSKHKRTQVAVFDANHIADGPLAIASLPYWLPLGFHGNFAAL